MDMSYFDLSSAELIAEDEDTVSLFKLWDSNTKDLFLFEYPNGEREYAQVEISDTYTAAWSQREGPLYVFKDGEFHTKLDLKVWNALPLDRGYLVLNYGTHQDLIFAIYSLTNNEMVLQRKVTMARGLEATPNERYVATWRLTDATVYIYDVEEASEAGRFCTSDTEAVNVNLYGRVQNGEQVFEIEDNTSNTTIGYITIDGTFSS